MSSLEIIDIPNGYELRVQLHYGQEAIVESIEGTVTYCAWVLQENKPIVFRDQPFAVTAFSQAKVKMRISNVPYYIAPFYLPEIIREDKTVILITGAKASGKTTYAKWLLNSRLIIAGDRSIYVNLDPSQAPFGVPGCIGCMEITKPINNNGFPFLDPLLFFFGNTEIKDDYLELYRDQILQVQAAIFEKEAKAAELNIKPVNCIVIDFPMLKPIEGVYDEIAKIICDAFGVTHIVVLGNEYLKRNLPKNPTIKLINCPVLPGAIYIDEETKSKLLAEQIKKYFMGTPERPLEPVVCKFPRSDFKVYSFGPLRYISSIMLPSGMEKPNPKNLSFVGLSSLLNRRLLAIVPEAEKDVWAQNVIGFFCVLNITDSKNADQESFVEVLAPNAEEISNYKRIAGTIEYKDPKELL